MIKIDISTRDDAKKLKLKMVGHAGAGAFGSDIVCASASMLAYTVAQSVQDMEDGGELDGKVNIRLDKGDSMISITCKDEDSYARAKQVFLVAQTGFTLLAHNYPGHVTLKKVIKAECFNHNN